jgi:hypothetical protein
MPPRYAYWTILVDEQPTAFRSSLQEELMPTFKRLKEKHPSARMVWFQNGKVWASRLDAQEAMRERGERGRARDSRQAGGLQDRKRTERLEWKPKGEVSRPKLDWKPKSAERTGRGRDKSWRPGGEHKDPRQKYKDAKKAKWQRFKKNVRSRWQAKQGNTTKRRDDES